MIAFRHNGHHFHYRVAAVAIHKGCVLLHHAETDPFWALPGGRVEMMETSHQALIREMQEEINTEVIIDRLLYCTENFFPAQYPGQTMCHELCLYFLVHFAPGDPILDHREPFFGQEGSDLRLIFEWVPLEAIKNRIVYPCFLRTALLNMSSEIQHIIEDQREP